MWGRQGKSGPVREKIDLIDKESKEYNKATEDIDKCVKALEDIQRQLKNDRLEFAKDYGVGYAISTAVSAVLAVVCPWGVTLYATYGKIKDAQDFCNQLGREGSVKVDVWKLRSIISELTSKKNEIARYVSECGSLRNPWKNDADNIDTWMRELDRHHKRIEDENGKASQISGWDFGAGNRLDDIRRCIEQENRDINYLENKINYALQHKNMPNKPYGL